MEAAVRSRLIVFDVRPTLCKSDRAFLNRTLSSEFVSSVTPHCWFLCLGLSANWQPSGYIQLSFPHWFIRKYLFSILFSPSTAHLLQLCILLAKFACWNRVHHHCHVTTTFSSAILTWDCDVPHFQYDRMIICYITNKYILDPTRSTPGCSN